MAEIVRCVIHPGLGIARVGNSPDQYHLGPEAPGQSPVPAGGYKDPAGRIKRQGARFRVYGLDSAGKVVAEVTADVGTVAWRVHLANRKSAWYQFLNAMDLGTKYAKTPGRRNSAITGTARTKLVIDPGPRSIAGRSKQGTPYRFDSGTFMGAKVPLGELRTDDQGRLIVLGGFGASSSYLKKPATTFANNDGWHDDTSDGWVRATVTIGGKKLEAEPAAVAVTPPNFGPGLYGVVTLYDVVYDLFCRDPKFALDPPARPAFWRHIYPVLSRLVDTGWVNSGADVLFGPGSPSRLTTPELLAQLADPAPEHRALRTGYASWFRDPALKGGPQTAAKLPPFYGDAFGDYRQLGMDDLAVTPTQYRFLQQWAAGDFDPDPSLRRRPATLADYPVTQQPRALDEANLESCLGGPFHPGIELTWTLRVASMWKAPFRLNQLAEGATPKTDYGVTLTPAEALGAGGVVSASGPGTLTWWMGVPWQTDEASCLAGYEIGTYLPLPSFWAARVPNQVLSERSYERVMDADLPTTQRLKHLFHRLDWLRFFGPDRLTRLNDNITRWPELGIVTSRTGPTDLGAEGVPDRLWVETGLAASLTKSDPTWEQVKIAERMLGLPAEEAVLLPERAARTLAAEHEEVPPESHRRLLGRDEL
ncbi:LodA/GoxA family CTQ-dependent oxidase [Microlunatus aurantiacus]|uniref:LodA/GoxA family CTQ-dependent oxidase n=1 Tax=Microlunatus aurantiacus TaxID=446786 RepID=A0ABP7EDS5_9ACTN